MKPVRLPFAPLATFVGTVHVPSGRAGWWQEASPARAVAIACGVVCRQSQRWERYGVTIDQADELADALGAHPTEIWPDYHYLATWSPPEPEFGPNGEPYFCGRPMWWSSTGHADWYGNPSPFCEAFRALERGERIDYLVEVAA